MKMRTSRGSAWFWLLEDRITGRERQWQVEATWLQQPRSELRGRLIPSSGGQHDQQTGSRGEGSSGNHLSTDSSPEKREAAVASSSRAGPRRHGRDGKEERNFRLARRPQRTTGSHWRWQALFSTSIVVFHASVLWLLPLYLPHTWPPTRCTKCRLACLRLHRFLLAPGPGRHPPLAILWSIVSQRPASRITTPQQRRVRVYTGAAPAAPPRHLAQPWSKGTWRIGIGTGRAVTRNGPNTPCSELSVASDVVTSPPAEAPSQ